MFLKYNYVSSDKEENLISYKYKGKENSLIYNYILGPFANL